MKDTFVTICDHFGVGTYIRHRSITEGVLNQNYVLETDKGTFFIKGLKGKKHERLKYIYAVESLMVREGIPASRMLTGTNDSAYIELDEVCYTMYSFIESDREHKYSNEDYIRMGEMLAKIHAVTYGKEVDEAFVSRKLRSRSEDEILEKLHQYKKLIEEKTEQSDLDKEFLNYINLKLSLATGWKIVEDLPNDTLIHGDYHAGNLLINRETREIIAICDWEKAEYFSRCYELARAIIYIAFDADIYNFNNSLTIAESFLIGYKNVLDISEKEFEHALRMRLTRHVITSWIENMWYGENNDRANHFIKNEVRILKDFVQGDGITKLKSILQRILDRSSV